MNSEERISNLKLLYVDEYIQSILNKTHEIIEYHSTSMYDSAEKFVQL